MLSHFSPLMPACLPACLPAFHLSFCHLSHLSVHTCTCAPTHTITRMHKHTMHLHVHTAIHVIQTSTQVLYMYILTHTCACTYAYRQDIHTTQSPAFILSVSYICTTLRSICTVFFSKIVTAPWDYALCMAYDNEACYFTHHARHYHGWRGNSSRFLDLPVRMMKRSATCGCQAWTTQ